MKLALLFSALAVPGLAAPAPPPAKMSAEEKIVFEVATGQVTAFNAGDATAYAKFFTADAEWRDEAGGILSGRADIEKAMAEAMVADKGRKLDFDIENIRRISPDVLSAKGSTTVTFPDASESTKGFTALVVRREGKWLISDYSESAVAPAATVEESLKTLDWLVGTWEEKSEKQIARCTVEWSFGKRFLDRKTQVTASGEPERTSIEHIGWDAELGLIRSWIFDSEGGVTENIWQPIEKGWSIASLSTLPDGLSATAELELLKVDDNTLALTTKKRAVAGEPLPDLPEQRFVRAIKK
jgi:uncharacterized protein (TIGR02246 family)